MMLTKQALASKQAITKLESHSLVNSSSMDAGKVLYYGGPVISHAQIYMILWGDKISDATKKSMPDFYASVLNSNYMDWLKIYNTNGVSAQDGREGTNQEIGRGSFIQTIQINPSQVSGTLDDTVIRAELDKAITAGILPKPSADILFMIHFPPNLKITFKDETGTVATSCQQFCAYHMDYESKTYGNIYYGVIPNLDSMACSMGCGFGGSLVRQTVCASHEVTEAITDPIPTPGNSPKYPQAWNTNDGNEVGDLCQSATGNLKGKAAVYKVQQEWNNSTNGCTTGDYL